MSRSSPSTNGSIAKASVPTSPQSQPSSPSPNSEARPFQWLTADGVRACDLLGKEIYHIGAACLYGKGPRSIERRFVNDVTARQVNLDSGAVRSADEMRLYSSTLEHCAERWAEHARAWLKGVRSV